MMKNCYGGHVCGWGSEVILRTRIVATGDLRLRTGLGFSRMYLCERNGGPFIFEKVHSEMRASLEKALSYYRRHSRIILVVEVLPELIT